MSESEREKKKISTKQAAFLTFVIVLVLAIAAAVYFFFQYQKAQQLLQNPTLAAQLQENALLAQVGKLMVLPTGEVPQVATVSDVSKLKDQPFFSNAKNGDKVLIYTKARQAILYDPIANKIINVAPVNLGNNTAVHPTVAATPTPIKTVIKITPKATPTPTK